MLQRPSHFQNEEQSTPDSVKPRRKRRAFAEIDRIYKCTFADCKKSYGTLNNLNHHIALQSHGFKRKPDEFKELRQKMYREKLLGEIAPQRHDTSNGMWSNRQRTQSTANNLSMVSFFPRIDNLPTQYMRSSTISEFSHHQIYSQKKTDLIGKDVGVSTAGEAMPIQLTSSALVSHEHQHCRCSLALDTITDMTYQPRQVPYGADIGDFSPLVGSNFSPILNIPSPTFPIQFFSSESELWHTPMFANNAREYPQITESPTHAASVNADSKSLTPSLDLLANIC